MKWEREEKDDKMINMWSQKSLGGGSHLKPTPCLQILNFCSLNSIFSQTLFYIQLWHLIATTWLRSQLSSRSSQSNVQFFASPFRVFEKSLESGYYVLLLFINVCCLRSNLLTLDELFFVRLPKRIIISAEYPLRPATSLFPFCLLSSPPPPLDLFIFYAA